MATLPDLLASWDASLSGAGYMRIPSGDYRSDLDRLTVGTQYYQLRGEVDGRELGADSNVGYWRCNVEIAWLRLVPLLDERDYTESAGAGSLWTQATAYMSAETWRAMPEVFDVVGGPELEDSIERDGNLVTWSFKAQVLLAP